MRLRKLGFSLIEIIIVLGVTGILVTVGLSSFSNTQQTGRDARRRADLEQIRSALEMYRSNDASSRYPVLNPGTNCSSLPGLVPQYIAQIPTDPHSPNRIYYCYSDGTTYEVKTSLEKSTTPCGAQCGALSNCNLTLGPYGTTCGP